MIMYNEADSDSSWDIGSTIRKGVKTEKNPNHRVKKSCNCKKECNSRVCSCYKHGSGCNSNCKFTGCKNIFKDLQYFFDDWNTNKVYSATPCFSSYLVKHGQNGFQSIDRDELRKRIMNCKSYWDIRSDPEIVEWTKTWNQIRSQQKDEPVRFRHTQMLFRLLLSRDSTFYYSFCDDEIYRANCYWHCISCEKCNEWRAWHCGQCNNCVPRLRLSCDNCGGISDTRFDAKRKSRATYSHRITID